MSCKRLRMVRGPRHPRPQMLEADVDGLLHQRARLRDPSSESRAAG